MRLTLKLGGLIVALLIVVAIVYQLRPSNDHTKPVQESNQPVVLASIKPLQLIAAAITTGVTKPEVLVPPGESPHTYSMKPSNLEDLKKANVILWVGPDLEVFLPKIIKDSKADAVITANQLPGMTLLKSGHYDDDTHDHHHDHDHDHGDINPHIWLDPDNAVVIAAALAEQLSKIDPMHASVYQTNLEVFKTKLEALNQEMKKNYKELTSKGFFVYHDAWDYLAHYYHLKVIDAFTLNPEQQPGARHLAQLRQKMASAGSTCVFQEPQFRPRYLDRIIENLDVKVGEIDPLAIQEPINKEGYIDFLRNTLTTIGSCLKQTS